MTPPCDPAELGRVRFDERGLVPVVAQEVDGTVLMLAWANREALDLTVREGRAVYWSRSRKALWRKGDTSGHTQEVVGIRVDCDGDTVLYTVRQTGPACHTGARSCFESQPAAGDHPPSQAPAGACPPHDRG